MVWKSSEKPRQKAEKKQWAGGKFTIKLLFIIWSIVYILNIWIIISLTSSTFSTSVTHDLIQISTIIPKYCIKETTFFRKQCYKNVF